MRISVGAVVLGMSMLAVGCVDAESGDGVAINRGALGSAPSNPALDGIGARYIVKYRDAANGKAALQASGAQVVLELGPQNAAAAHIPPQALEALRNNPNIEYIEEDPVRQPLATTTGETSPYGIAMVQADQVTEGASGSVAVCIIDSGYYTGHEDLGSGHVSGYTPSSGALPWNEDGCGHGDHVAGTIRALGGNGLGVVGVNPSGNLDLYIVRVFGNDCAWAYASSLVDALNRCQSGTAGKKLVVSMSLGGGTSSATENNAFQTAYNNGVLSIAAAGNDGTTATSYPAGYSSVVSVAAIDSTKTVASFSQKNADVEIAAPGVGVRSTVPFVDTASVTANGTAYDGHPVEFAAQKTASGPLAYGTLCDAVGAWTGKVVLCDRGTISFYDKVHNAQLGGAVGVVIANNNTTNKDEELFATLGAGNSSTIPAIGVTYNQGQALRAAVGATADLVNTHVWPASGYEAWDGTSMATPHVSGVAALVWSNYPTKTNADIRAALTSSALDLGTAGRDNSYGYGLVQAKAAFDKLAGGGGGTGDVTPPVISNVQGTVINARKGTFKITWTTDEASDSTVTIGSSVFNNATLVTAHSMSLRGTRGATYSYNVSSKDAAGNVGTSGPYSITIK